MAFVYEFACEKGHVTEVSVPMGTTEWPCKQCNEGVFAARMLDPKVSPAVVMAKRILSPTGTTFRFADRWRDAER